MRILVKMPTRSRPEQAMRVLSSMRTRQSGEHAITYALTIDADDTTCRHLWSSVNPIVTVGRSTSKVHAVNRDMDKMPQWDILLLASDDMWCVADRWDATIARDMLTHYPDADGCLWYLDGWQENICTMPIFGRAYYERFNYVYHPAYKSLWCDNEQTDVGLSLNRLTRCPVQLFEHRHPAWGMAPLDNLYRRNEALYKRDERIYHERKKQGFPIQSE